VFEPLNALERKLIAATTDPSARAAFTQAMLDADLYCSPAGEVAPGAQIGPMVVVYLEPGRVQASALFTAPERLREVVGQDARILARSGRALLEELGDHPIQLNPNLAPSVIWSVEDIAQILGTSSRPVAVPAGTQMLLTHPAIKPDALISALASGLGALGAVKGAWLLQAQRSGQPEPSWLLGVEHGGSWNIIDAAITRAIAGVDLGGRTLEATPITMSPLSRDLRGGIPIVAPKRRGFFDFLKG
jgi:hypothetical protein